jgi:hypothetical protein
VYIVKRFVAVLALLLIAVPVAAIGAQNKTVHLIPISATAMAITGKVTLQEKAGDVVYAVVFENGSSLHVTGGSGGVYRVTPPANPILLYGSRLCDGSPPTRLVLTWGIRGAITMVVYHGAAMTDKTLCGTFFYNSAN